MYLGTFPEFGKTGGDKAWHDTPWSDSTTRPHLPKSQKVLTGKKVASRRKQQIMKVIMVTLKCDVLCTCVLGNA